MQTWWVLQLATPTSSIPDQKQNYGLMGLAEQAQKASDKPLQESS